MKKTVNGWQEFYEPRPTWFQWLKYKLFCRWLGHHWGTDSTGNGVPCKRCGYNSVQMN